MAKVKAKTKTETTMQYNEKPISQKVIGQIDAKLCIIESLKVYSNDKRIDRIELSVPSIKAKLAKINKGDVKTFWNEFRPYTRKDKLKVDSASEKANLCRHARMRQHCFNVIARLFNRPDLIVEYGKKAAEAKAKS